MARHWHIAACMILGIASHARAQDGVSSHACASIARSSERLACYDRAFPLPEQTREAMAQHAVEDFGRDARTLAGTGDDGEEQPAHIQAKVVRVEYHDRGGRTIHLDNGQRWSVTEATTRGPLRDGDDVTLRKGAMGSFLLTTSAGIGLRVRRVR